MSGDVCPWWMGYLLDNPVRRWIHNPERMYAPYVENGMTALDLGAGTGFSSLALARLVGDGGQVIAVDLQRKMLNMLERRARRAGFDGRVKPHLCQPQSIGVETPVDFAVAFWMVHEVPDVRGFLEQVGACLKPTAKFLIVEPRMHVSKQKFAEMLAVSAGVGLKAVGEPSIRLSRSVLLAR
jgi:ubiquinone/menaquinone biosynthesis C-methylase UbiE